MDAATTRPPPAPTTARRPSARRAGDGTSASTTSRSATRVPTGSDRRTTSPRPFLHALLAEADDLGDARRPLLRRALGGVDPAHVRLPVELGEAVPEVARLRLGRQRGSQVG